MKNLLWCTGHPLKINNVVKAEGSFLYDDQGGQYMDLESGVWTVLLGHNHPGINRAIEEQLGKVTHCGYYNSSSIVDNAARAVLEITGLQGGKCIFLCSGSEAVECGIQALHKITGKLRLLCLHDSYLGSYGYAGKGQVENWHLLDWTACRNCSEADNCRPDCPVFELIPFEELGGFVFEPGSASGLVRFPSLPFIRNLVKLVKDNNGLILINEVTTGLGRTGRWFGYNHYYLQPDLVAAGKGIGNGYPVSVLAIGENAARLLTEKSFYYQQSHQNDALGSRVVCEVIRELKKNNLVNRSEKLGAELLNNIKKVCLKYDICKEIRGKGLMIALEFEGTDDQPAAYLHDHLFKKGFITSFRRGYNTLRIDPPLTVERIHLNNFIETLDKALANTSQLASPLETNHN